MQRMFAALILGCLAVVNAAPAELLPAGVTRLDAPSQYLILSPAAQIPLQPAFKFQQQAIQPLSTVGSRIQSVNGEQMILLYPGASGVNQIPLVTLKQNEQSWSDQIQGWISSWGWNPSPGDKPAETPSEDPKPADDSAKAEKQIEMMMMTQQKLSLAEDAETFPLGMVPQQTPASTVPLNPMPERRFFVVSGQPQFFGNFPGLQDPMNPIFSLQPLQALKARSAINPIGEIGQEKNLEQPIAAAASLPQSLPLRFGGEEVEPEPAEPVAVRNVNPEAFVPSMIAPASIDAPGVAANSFARFLLQQNLRQVQPETVKDVQVHGVAAQEFAKFLAQARSQQNIEQRSEVTNEVAVAHSVQAEALKEGPAVRASVEPKPAVAQAIPVAVAVTGKGGLAQASPLSTAIVGHKGLAISAPQATSVAGDFSSEEKVKKLPKMPVENPTGFAPEVADAMITEEKRSKKME